MRNDTRIYIRPRSSGKLAFDDACEALRLSWFWVALGWNDILQRYRGSMLGPFWITLTTAVFIVGLGPLFAQLFNLDMATYLPFMALGVTTWNLITGIITDACNAFISCSHLIQQIRLPKMLLLFRVVWRNVIIFLHYLPIYIVIFLAFDLPFDWHLLAIIPGFLLVCLNLTWMGLCVAILCARFRDFAPIIGSFLQISFFLTPVMWNHKTQRVDEWVVNLNPFAALIEVIRAPILSEAISAPLLHLAIGTLIIGTPTSALLFVSCRRKIAYWV